jgi:hypothetical protein
MENPRVLDRKGWSVIRKAQVAFTAFGALLTLAELAFDAAKVTIPHDSPFAGFLFSVGLLLTIPADGIARTLGIQNALGFWGWTLLEIAVNTILAFAVGSLVGWVVAVARYKPDGGRE